MEVKSPGIRQSEVGLIPDDWIVRPVSQMGEVRSGKALAVNAPGEQRPYLRTTNVLDGSIALDDVLWMPMTDAEFSRFQLLPDDVLLNEGQTTELVGRCSLYSGEYGAPCAMQNQLLRFRAKPRVSARFAAHLFRQCQKNGVFAGIATQTTSVAHLGLKRFEGLKLAWPPLEAEQEAIAEALSDADALIESLEQLIAKKRLVKQGVMQELLTGKRRLPGFEGEWEEKALSQLANIRSGGTPSTGQPQFWNGSIPWTTPTDITALSGRKYLDGTARTITALGVSSSSAELIPAGSVLMTSRATIGECAINQEPVTTNQGFKSFVPLPSTDAHFLYYLLTTQKQGFISLCGGSTFLEIGKTQLIEYVVRLPATKGEQTAIAAVLSDIDLELEALEDRASKARKLKQGMMQQLLTGRIRLT